MDFPETFSKTMVTIQEARLTDDEKKRAKKKKLLEQMRAKEQAQQQLSKNSSTKKVGQSNTGGQREVLQLKISPGERKAQSEISQLKNKMAGLQLQLKKDKKKIRQQKQQNKELRKAQAIQEQVIAQKLEVQRLENIRVQEKVQKELAALQEIKTEMLAAGWNGDLTWADEIKWRNEKIAQLRQLRQQDRSYLDNTVSREKHLNKRIAELNEANNSLFNKKKGWEHERRDLKNQQERLHFELVQQEQQVVKLRQQAEERQRFNPYQTIFRLIQNLDTKTFRQYNPLNKLFEQYEKIFNYQAAVMEKENSEVLYGYLEVREKAGQQNLFFHDLEDASRPLLVPENFQRHNLLKDGTAIQVYRKKNRDGAEPETVRLGYCYPIVEKKTAIATRHIKKIGKLAPNAASLVPLLANEDVKKWSARLTITIVGNKNVDRFSTELAKYVGTVNLVDAYEKGETRTFELMRKADFSFVFTDSVPHSVMFFIKDFDPERHKTQEFYLPNQQDGVIRLNYLYWNRKNNLPS